MIAKVDVEAPSSKVTAQEQDVKSYPTIKFFRAGSSKPEDYSGERQEKNFIDFLNEQTGTHRVPGGGLDGVAGTIEAFDRIVAKYTGGFSLEDATAEASKAAEEIKEEAQLKNANYYVRVFEKLSENESYATKELGRLEGILSKGELAPIKADEIKSKTNVLRRFVKADKDTNEKDEL